MKTAYARLAGAGSSRASIALRTGWMSVRTALLSAASAQTTAITQSSVAKARGTWRRQSRSARRASPASRDTVLGVNVASLAPGDDAEPSAGPS